MTPIVTAHNPESGQDLDIIKAIRAGSEIDVCIPDSLSSKQLFDAIHQIGGMIDRTDRFGRALRYGFGKMMVMAANRPEFLRENGFTKFQEFEDAMIQATGLERSTLWSWKPIFKELPDLTREQLATISAEHFKLILKIPDQGRRILALEAAPDMSYRAFQRFVEDRGFVGAGESEGATFILSGSKDEIAELRSYLESAAIQEFAGNKPVEILLAALHETASAGWPTI